MPLSLIAAARCRALRTGALAACLLGAAASSASAEPPPGRDELRRDFDELLSKTPLQGARVGVEVISLDDGKVVYARNEGEQLNPASNTKLVTAATALLRLGPEFRFTTELRSDSSRLKKGRIKNLYVKGGGDPTIDTERLQGLVADLWHRGVRAIQGDLILDDGYFDGSFWGPGWEQETSDKAYAAPAGALSLNHNSVGVYVWPGERRGQKARVEIEPESRYFTVFGSVDTVRSGGRRRVVIHTSADGDRTRIEVRGRTPVNRNGLVMFRRVYDPTLYFGETMRVLLAQRGIKLGGKVRKGAMPASATLVASYDSPELADIVRDMNKVSSNFIAEMLVKALGAELKGAPGTWQKGIEVAQELLAELGLPRGSYTLKNGSGLNDTNRFSAHQLATLLAAVWKRFPVAAEFVSSLGIAGRDGTLRLRMEATQAAGRLRAKTGTLEHVTALSGYVQSIGGERFAFSIMVNEWQGRASPVVHAVDRLGGAMAAAGTRPLTPREQALAQLAAAHGDGAGPAELRARFATYEQLATTPDKKNLPFLRSAVATERDPLLRLAAADALYHADPELGGPALLDAAPLSPEPFEKLRSLAKELQQPLPVLSALLDLAADGNAEALARVLALAPLARTAQGDDLLTAMSDGLEEVGHNAPEELLAALHAAPPEQAQAALELIGYGLALAADDADTYELAAALRSASAAKSPDAQAQGWLAVLERRVLAPPAGGAPAGASTAVAVARPAATDSTPPAAKGDQSSADEDDDDTPDQQAPGKLVTAAEGKPAINAPAPAPAAAVVPAVAPAASALPAASAPAASSSASAPAASSGASAPAASPGASVPAASPTATAPAAPAAVPAVAPAASDAKTAVPASATDSKPAAAPAVSTSSLLPAADAKPVEAKAGDKTAPPAKAP